MNRLHTSYGYLALIALIAALPVMYVLSQVRSTDTIYERILHSPSNKAVSSLWIDDNTTVHAPSWDLFTPNNIWMLASRYNPLPASYKASDIIATAAPHANDATEVSARIEPHLLALMTAAKADGVDLMISSAYRSISEQQTLYETFVAEQGQEMADRYVAKPGTSEHHTGLAVDFGDASEYCQEDSNSCSLGMDAIIWLQENAPRFGFILRYPEGQKPVTGIEYEPWHYRYVGIPLAQAMQHTDLTLDEVLSDMYPTLARE